MKFLQLFLPIGTALLLVLFFSCLPNLKTCRLSAPDAAARRLTRRDAPPLLALTLLYALTAFYNLGDRAAPQTFAPMRGETAVLTLPAGASPSALMLYCGVGHGDYQIDYSADGETWVPAADFSQGHVEVLKWHSISPSSDLRARYIRVTCVSGEPWLGELAPLDGDGLPIPCTATVPALSDEPELAPARQTFRNSTYFDEIYHARTAWEHLHGVWPYEISHPPLGKEILSLGILAFGMTPFGWRFMGTLFGVLMLPLLYVFLKQLFGGRAAPTAGTAVFALDFMHYAQTRIATIDTYSVFFILLMYLFFWLWLRDGSRRALALSGLAFGLGAAAKWTSIYAGAGLAVLWLGHWVLRFLAAGKGGAALSSQTGAPPVSSRASDRVTGVGPALQGTIRPPQAERTPVFPAFLRNALFCVVFFVLLPGLIYYLSYLPYGAAAGVRPFTAAYTRIVLDNQVYMFTYHSSVQATHPYSSRWYQWLLDIRPILYYLEYLPDGRKVSIGAFLNPMLCWGGLLSLPVLGWGALARRDRRAVFLLVGYLAELLPWVFIERLTFAYHYFPSSLFLALALGYVFSLLRENRAEWRWLLAGFVGVTGLLFAVFFPALNGLPISQTLASALMKWLPTWPL